MLYVSVKTNHGRGLSEFPNATASRTLQTIPNVDALPVEMHRAARRFVHRVAIDEADEAELVAMLGIEAP